MSELAIHVENLSKLYKIGAKQGSYKTLREGLTDGFKSLFHRNGGAPSVSGHRSSVTSDSNTIWALKDISFEVKHGEVIGIIGRNGAGKSTLLKVLSRITEPTRGAVHIRGRVGSLLEVGTGFHPELTGRENICLNGAILGMKRTEINRNFDEIVAFAGIEKFIDTPVKHYSSGMYLRLAFAVAAHLEPEILMVDEVLAVGDAVFRKKCLNKMQDVGKDGRTVLFVSHDMAAISRLCERTILLDNSHLLRDGPSQKVVSAYLNSSFGTRAARNWTDSTVAPGNDVVRLRGVRIRSPEGEVMDAVDIRQPVGIEIEYEVLRAGYVLCPHFTLYNEDGIRVFASFDLDPAWRQRVRLAGHYVSIGWIPGNLLAEGTMFVGPAIRSEGPQVIHFYERGAVAFQVIDSLEGDSARGDIPEKIGGVVRPLLQWETQFSPSTLRSLC